ncbi:MAG TPA: hypothetical protein VJV79_01265 [Polyangiaceae bacterium]|nr:hypothetical protein [Polyangiaceae bacterium]
MRPAIFARIWLLTLLLAPACRGRVSKCEGLASESARSQCYTQVAIAGRSPRLCSALRSALGQARCLEALALDSKDAEYCALADARIPSPHCFEALARVSSDPSVCGKIRPPILRQRCLAHFLDTSKDAQLCARMSLPAQRDACLERLVERDPKSVGLCAQAVHSGGCYRAAAIRDAPALCERVGSGANARARRACYDDALVQARTDPTLKARPLTPQDCEGIPHSAQQARCWTQLAPTTHDASQCPQLSAAEEGDDCWFDAAMRNADHCLHVGNSSGRANCALRYWPTATTAAVCAELAPDELKHACIRHAEAKMTKP